MSTTALEASVLSPPATADRKPRTGHRGRRKTKDVEEEGTIITVSYGPRTEIIGTIKVPEAASYANVRELIHPLVIDYYGRLKQSAEDSDGIIDDPTGDMTDAFRMVDANDKVIDRYAEGVSTLRSTYCLLRLLIIVCSI